MDLTDSIALGRLLVAGLLIVLAGVVEVLAENLLGRGRWREADWIATLYPALLFGGVFFGLSGLTTMYL
ncbi:gp36 [Rhodococcus phage ReqiPine5]|uniref:Gp36 n=1 Tax=Rhodococcus phage ReqiPine5 TaxID=691963 RepID=D4P811_9CAUD|nr:gp36 [Rhodococcus phage ReqiPine5]ADD81141.1 gp36 [Rhodococcus phage ReqiPine5]